MGQEVKELVECLREVARPEKLRERLTLVSIFLSPCQTGFFLFVALGVLLVRPPSFAFLCPSAP